MSFKLVTLDGRHLGHQLFKYSVKLRYNIDSEEDFIKIREWCWNTFGPSMELDLWMDIRYSQSKGDPKWSWHAPRTSYLNSRPLPRIYLASDRQAAEFLLRWA